jgi:hypothetical protein
MPSQASASLPSPLELWKEKIMAESPLTLSDEERTYLVELLENTLKNRRVEEHRTRAPTYREHVLHQEELIVALLKKLGQPTVA